MMMNTNKIRRLTFLLPMIFTSLEKKLARRGISLNGQEVALQLNTILKSVEILRKVSFDFSFIH